MEQPNEAPRQHKDANVATSLAQSVLSWQRMAASYIPSISVFNTHRYSAPSAIRKDIFKVATGKVVHSHPVYN